MSDGPPSSPPWELYSARQRAMFVTVLFLLTISSNFDYYILGMVLEPIKNEFHVSDTRLGFLTGFCFALCYALAALPFARWTDRGNRRTILWSSLLGWSVLSIFFGTAHTFWQLAVARFGVGAMEPGATPPAQSLVADYFPPERRSSALAVTLSGGSIGYLIALALGGYIAATLGWRNAFLIAGGFGIVLAGATRALLSEPRVTLGYTSRKSAPERLLAALSELRHKRSFVFTVLGVSIFYFFSVGVTTFLPSYLIRTLHVSLARVSLTWGVAIPSANLIGTLAGGWIADRLGRRDIRWYAWLSATSCVLGALLYFAALATNDLWQFIGAEFLAELLLWTGTFASWSAVHAVCGNPRRGTAIAVLQFAYILIGVGLGPLIAGAISDALGAYLSAAGLGVSLRVMTLSLIPAALMFYWSGHSILRDRAD